MLARRLDDAHGQSRRTGRDDRICGSSRINIHKELDLEVLSFRSALLDKVRVRERVLHVASELKMISRGIRRKSKYLERVPGGVNEPTQISLCIRRRIGRDDVEAACQVQGGPARTNGSCTNDRYLSHFF